MRCVLLLSLLIFITNSLAARSKPTLPFAVRPGLTGDSCKSADDCSGDRRCAPRNTLTVATCEGRSDCQCKFDQPRGCQRNGDCEEGELCVNSLKNSDGNTCHSASAAQEDESLTPVEGVPQVSPSATDGATDGVCIHVEALSHLASHALVFQQHPLARVLCDQSGSCATPGHIVTFNHKPMMMLSYCQIAFCESKLMRVNSPRYSRGMRLPSRTKGLQYTVLAARYQTIAEETVLGAVVRFGL